MYRLLSVGDEEFEREGMEQLINWEKYDIEMKGYVKCRCVYSILIQMNGFIVAGVRRIVKPG